MKIKGFIVSLIIALLISACSKDEADTISLATSGVTELYSVTNQSADIKFKASGSWKASCAANWLTFSPRNGEAGTNTITVSTTVTNRTGYSRVTNLTIESGGGQKAVPVKQRGEYALFESQELNLPSEGATVGMNFWTNIEKNQLHLYASAGLSDWLKTTEYDARTRTEYTGSIYPLRALPNESTSARDGALFLVMEDKGNVLGLDTLFVYQEGKDVDYVSSDYSQDGKVELLNKATEGNGIPIVLMGDGFMDD